MKAMANTSHQAVNVKTKHYNYIGLALSLLLLGNATTAGLPALAASDSGTAKLILAEATPPDTSKKADADDDQDKKAEKQKRKQEKQDAKAADKAKKEDDKAAEKSKKDDIKSKKDEDKAAEKSKKDDDKTTKKDDKASDKAKKDEKDAEKEKAKKDEKAKQVSDKPAKTDKPVNTAKGKEAGDDAKKEGDESKTAEADTRIETPPNYAPDAALISVLKDLSRSLKESEEFTKIEDPAQKAVVELAHSALRKALEDSQLSSNRIVEKVGKDNDMPPMGTEAWSSGELDLGDDGRAALSVVWAKRENGLMMVTIAGTTDKKAPKGKKIGEYVVVINARSSVENGFDIQSQQNVSFWLGKVGSITIESDCVPAPVPPAAEGAEAKTPNKVSEDDEAVKKKSLIILPVLLTNRRREYLAAVMAVEKHNALVSIKLAEAAKAEADAKAESKTDAKGESSSTSQISDLPPGVEAKTMQEAYERALRAVAMKELMKMTPNSEAEKPGAEKGGTAASKEGNDQAAKDDNAQAAKTEANAATKSNQKSATAQNAADNGKYVESSKQSQAPAQSQPTGQPQIQTQAQTQHQPSVVAQQGETQVANQTTSNPQSAAQPQANQVAMLPAHGTTVINPGPDNVSAFRAVRQPSVGAMMMVPERALAGQSMTISIYDSKRNPEASVELSLNGSTMISNIDGQVSFTIPEDATPGRSLNVALAARPEVMPTVIDILQPLIVPSEKQTPSIEGVTLTGTHNDTLVINGHFFDGIAPNNKISIDGQVQGRIAAASPVELRVSLPITLQGGEHTVVVSCDGMNSNLGTFTTEAPPAPPPSALELKKKPKQPRY